VDVTEARTASAVRTTKVRTSREKARDRAGNRARSAATRTASTLAREAALAHARTAAVKVIADLTARPDDPPVSPPVTPPTSTELDTFRQLLRDELLRLHNEERQAVGFSTLTSLAPVTVRAGMGAAPG
jgi:hypothetical protein